MIVHFHGHAGMLILKLTAWYVSRQHEYEWPFAQKHIAGESKPTHPAAHLGPECKVTILQDMGHMIAV